MALELLFSFNREREPPSFSPPSSALAAPRTNNTRACGAFFVGEDWKGIWNPESDFEVLGLLGVVEVEFRRD